MIRKITPSDREIYLKMAHAFYHSPAVLHPVADSHLLRAFEEMMRSEDYLLGFIFEQGGEIAGYAQIARTWSQEAGGAVAWIEEIYVLPEFQGQGLGRAFFAALETLVPAARYRLEVEPDNLRAQKLYADLGFEALPYRQMIRQVGSDADRI